MSKYRVGTGPLAADGNPIYYPPLINSVTREYHHAGDIVDLPHLSEKVAASYIKQGLLIPIEDEPKKSRKAAPEGGE